jgi:2-C-methyl-D-erythritol 2,4-cyclodiphosphate synthase
MAYEYRSSIGQDSHRFVDRQQLPATQEESRRPLMLGGVCIDGGVPLAGNSDADVILHALTNAVSGLTGQNILGEISDRMCQAGVTDSAAYLDRALETLGDWQLRHLSFTVEGKRPHLAKWIDRICTHVAELTGIERAAVCLTATTGEGLTGFGCGDGLQVFCILTARRDDRNP